MTKRMANSQLLYFFCTGLLDEARHIGVGTGNAARTAVTGPVPGSRVFRLQPECLVLT